MRRLASVALLASGAAAWWMLATGGATRPDPGLATRVRDPAACVQCHAQTVADWKESWHAKAFTDPEVVRLSNNFSNEQCIDCHAPRPVYETGPAARTLPRLAGRETGVDCYSCHAGTTNFEDAVAGRSPACTPIPMPWSVSSAAFCESCHNQHGTTDQWRAWNGGQTCTECHFPGGSHLLPGSHDPEMVRRAVELRLVEGDEPVIEVANVGAGHDFPTEERSRAVDLVWIRPDGTSERLDRYRDPYRDEAGLVNTQIPARAVRRYPVPGAGQIRLLYKYNPFQEDADAFEVHRLDLP